MLLSHRGNRHVLLTCILAAAASTILALALTARADASDIGLIYPKPVVQAVFPGSVPCASRAPDATATLPHPGAFTVESPFSYNSDSCGYIVDASVAATPEADITISPPKNYEAAEETCKWLRMSVTFYMKSWGVFTPYESGKFRGVWLWGYGCFLAEDNKGNIGQGDEPDVTIPWGYTWPTTVRVAASVHAETGLGSVQLPVTITGSS
jgi:hypothetical protein